MLLLLPDVLELTVATGLLSDFVEFKGRVTGSGLVEDPLAVAGRTSLARGAALVDRCTSPFLAAGWTAGAVLGADTVDVIPLGAGRV